MFWSSSRPISHFLLPYCSPIRHFVTITNTSIYPIPNVPFNFTTSRSTTTAGDLLRTNARIVEVWKTNLMSLDILFHFLCAQHVSDINISTFRSLRLCCWITTSVVLFSVRCVLEFWCGWLLMMDILMSETCWAHKKWNKISSDIKLVFHTSTITMMHGPINIRFNNARISEANNSCSCFKTPLNCFPTATYIMFVSTNTQSPFFKINKHLLALNLYVYKQIKIIYKYLYYNIVCNIKLCNFQVRHPRCVFQYLKYM